MYPLCIHFESSNKFCLNPEHKYISMQTKTYFPPEPKTDKTAQLEKKFLQEDTGFGGVFPVGEKLIAPWMQRIDTLSH